MTLLGSRILKAKNDVSFSHSLRDFTEVFQKRALTNLLQHKW